jgi:hypothetical protein
MVCRIGCVAEQLGSCIDEEQRISVLEELIKLADLGTCLSSPSFRKILAQSIKILIKHISLFDRSIIFALQNKKISQFSCFRDLGRPGSGFRTWVPQHSKSLIRLKNTPNGTSRSILQNFTPVFA